MPLEISLTNRKGSDDFYVGDTRVTLENIIHRKRFQLKVHGTAMDNVYTITEDTSVEILPKVRVSAVEKRVEREGEVSIVFQAPRRIEILRGRLYRERYGSGKQG